MVNSSNGVVCHGQLFEDLTTLPWDPQNKSIHEQCV
jgi:hypothetical protein